MLADDAGPDDEEDFVPDHIRLRDRYTERLRRRGLPNAEVAAAVASARGRAGETIAEFAQRLVVDEADVRAAEVGELGWEQLPPPLAFAVRRN